MKRFPKFLVTGIIIILVSACSSKENSEPQPEPQSQLPPDHPPISNMELKYTAPQSWTMEQPASSMRKAQYKLPGAQGNDPAELAVFHFPGTGGSVEANLDRWYGQFKQADGSSTKAKAETKTLMAKDLPVTLVYATGTYLKSAAMMTSGGPEEELPGYALLAAVVETNSGPWFFKATGPQKTIDYWRPEFEKFAQTFHF